MQRNPRRRVGAPHPSRQGWPVPLGRRSPRNPHLESGVTSVGVDDPRSTVTCRSKDRVRASRHSPFLRLGTCRRRAWQGSPAHRPSVRASPEAGHATSPRGPRCAARAVLGGCVRSPSGRSPGSRCVCGRPRVTPATSSLLPPRRPELAPAVPSSGDPQAWQCSGDRHWEAAPLSRSPRVEVAVGAGHAPRRTGVVPGVPAPRRVLQS